MLQYDYLIVGAGFAGAVLAERLASQLGKTCLVVDRRNHIGGNSYDRYTDTGVLIHQYGPHYFRTNSDRIRDYLGQFTEWHPVEYKILSSTHGRLWQFPINLNTFEQWVGHPSTPEEMEAYLAEKRVPIAAPANSEEVIVSQVGWELYEMFFKNYTRKQWHLDPRELDASVCGRIPIRTDRDDRYLGDRFQALPLGGYTRLFERMLNHPNIRLMLQTDYRELLPHLRFGRMIYTGMIDEYFEFRCGRLPYRSLRFEVENIDREFYQPAMQVNYPNDHDYTRIVEIKHATGQQTKVTSIVKEFPQAYAAGLEAYYPIPNPATRKIYLEYADMAARERNVSFVGRLATYKYYNMDQVVGMALAEFEALKAPGA
jgi:UDP-galactopyranose mutase